MLAIVEAVLLLGVCALTLRLVPQVLPPPPEAVPRPAVGNSPSARRRRRTEGFALLVAGLPIVLAAAVLAIGLPGGPGELAAVCFAALAFVIFAASFVMVALGGERMDRWRLRHYERTTQRLRDEREAYSQRVDPAVEREKGRRLVRWGLLLLGAQVASFAALLPVLLAGLSSSGPIRAGGGILSLAMLGGFVIWALRQLRR